MSKELPGKNLEKKIEKKIQEFGHLSLTAEEHKVIHSTPSQDLIDNPGKNEIDLMSDLGILDYLREQTKSMKELILLTGEDSSLVKRMDKDYQATLRYLKSIGRLPEGY